jgi:hypothetical protein
MALGIISSDFLFKLCFRIAVKLVQEETLVNLLQSVVGSMEGARTPSSKKIRESSR